MSIVVNIKKTQNYDVKIGRPSIFGNPFVIGEDGDRDEVVNKYKTYFDNRIKKDPIFKAKVDELKGKTLGCYCKPLKCHGDIIIDYLNNSEWF